MKLSFFYSILSFYIHYVTSFKNPNFPKISGFFGIIGPNVDKKTTNTLYDLFMGDGIIHGVFIDNGEIYPVEHLVETEKIKYEKKHNKIPKNHLMMPMYFMLNKLKLFPNVMGLSNTAFLDNDVKYNEKKELMTLFEIDKPYKIKLNFQDKNIETISKVDLQIEKFSAHSKYDSKMKKIHTINYDMMFNKLTYMEIDKNCKTIIRKSDLNTMYIPLIHDFMIYKDSLIFMDSPIIWNFLQKIPILFDKTKNTYINIFNLTTNKLEKYAVNTPGFYMFHFADIIEKNGELIIYGPQYDNVDISSLDLYGKYRKIIINKQTKRVSIEKNEELEKVSLDFPLKWKEYILLRKIENKITDEFILCKDLKIIKKIKLPINRYLSGEPAIVEYNSVPYVMGISYDSNDNGYFFIFKLFDIQDSYIERNLGYHPSIGFHSIFTKKE
jgi:carotenoid cleavage dioxygenase-like enzyme